MAPSPQLGYNHNIPHRGRLYHVQTEDSGIDKAHIFTHIFYDGTIIASNKVDYHDRLDEPNLSETVVGLMQESHKAMIRRLRSGEFDEKIVTLIGDHPLASNREAVASAPAAEAPDERPDRRPPPSPKPAPAAGPPLSPSPLPSTVADPSVTHPIYANAEARAQAESGAVRPSGPRRLRRRALGGIGGTGVDPNAHVPITQRRDIIVGRFASEHQAELDEEILALLREDAS